jgi:hypothetical protein
MDRQLTALIRVPRALHNVYGGKYLSQRQSVAPNTVFSLFLLCQRRNVQPALALSVHASLDAGAQNVQTDRQDDRRRLCRRRHRLRRHRRTGSERCQGDRPRDRTGTAATFRNGRSPSCPAQGSRMLGAWLAEFRAEMPIRCPRNRQRSAGRQSHRPSLVVRTTRPPHPRAQAGAALPLRARAGGRACARARSRTARRRRRCWRRHRPARSAIRRTSSSRA